jgi:hypothetical protein
MHRFFKFLGLIAVLLVGGCTVTGGENSRFERTGFPGVFEPSVTVIVDTQTNTVYVIGAGSLADGALAAALRRPNRVTNATASNAEATGGNGNNGNHGEGNNGQN